MPDFPPIAIHGGQLDLALGVSTLGDAQHRLTPIEIGVLSLLNQARPDTVPEAVLLERAWNYKATNTRTVSMAISRLRTKVEVDPRSPRNLLTVRGEGYRLAPEPDRVEERALRRKQIAVGRAAELEQVRAAFERGHGIVELIGPGGIGKSTVARELQQSGAIWVDLAQVGSIPGLLRRLTEALDRPGHAGAQAVRAAFAEPGRLVLDNAEDLAAEARTELASLLEGAVCQVLVTTRERLGLGHPVVLQPLEPDAALEVVNHARAASGLPEVDADAIRGVLGAFGGHALALTVAAPMLELGLDSSVLLGLDAGKVSLGAALRETLARLDPALREHLDAIAAFAAPPSVIQLADFTGASVPTLLRDLHELRERGLLVLSKDGVHVHPSIRAVIETPQHARHAAWLAGSTLDPLRLRPLRHELERALHHAHGDALADLLARHLTLLSTFGPLDGLLVELEPLLAPLQPDPRASVLWGFALTLVGDWEAARTALQVPVNAAFWEALATLLLGQVAAHTRDVPLSNRASQRLLELRTAIPDPVLRHMVTLQAAGDQLDTEQAAALCLEVERDPEAGSGFAFIAGLSRLRYTGANLADLRRLDLALERLGEADLGRRALHQRRMHLGQMWLQLGELERGVEQLRHGFAGLRALSSADASREWWRGVASAAHTPELARTLLAEVTDANEARDALAWMLGEAERPAGDPDLLVLVEAFREGRPVRTSDSWTLLSRSLQAAQRLGSVALQRSPPDSQQTP